MRHVYEALSALLYVSKNKTSKNRAIVMMKLFMPALLMLCWNDSTYCIDGDGGVEFEIAEVIDDILKTPAEKDRQFRGLVLKNGMKIVLVSDPTSSHSLVKISVEGVGGMTDPRQNFGMAHFVQRMLFQGSTKYPDSDHFFNLIRTYGGESNSYTWDVNTGYHFSIPSKHFEYALDVWAQFFIDPLFDETNIDRQVHSADPEYEIGSSTYEHILLSVLKGMCEDPQHPYCTFMDGNIETSQESCRRSNTSLVSLARKFYFENYSANMMHLVVFSPESLNELTKLVVPLFSKVQNKKLVRKVYNLPYGRKFIGKQVQIVSMSEDTKKLILTFQSPDLSNLHAKRIFKFIHHLFTHNWRGGFKDKLIRDGLIKIFHTNIKLCTNNFCILTFEFYLTDEGLENVPEILRHLFSFIAAIKNKHRYETWIYDEIKQSFKDSYENDPKMIAHSLSATILTSLRYGAPIQRVLTFPYTIEPELDQKSVDYVLSYFTPDNFNMAIMGRNFSGKTDRFDNYLKVNYKVMDIPAELLTTLKALDGEDDQTEIPKPSRFLLKRQGEKSRGLVNHEDDSQSSPRVILEDDLQRVWYARNNLSEESKIAFNLIVRVPTLAHSPSERSTRILLAGMLNNLFLNELPDARKAGFLALVNVHDSGFIIKLFGEKEKFQLFVEHVFLILLTGKFEMTVFQDELAAKMTTFDESTLRQPIIQAFKHLEKLTNEFFITPHETLSSIRNVTLADVEKARFQLFPRCHLESFVYGEISRMDTLTLYNRSLEIIRSVHEIEPLYATEIVYGRAVLLPDNSDYLLKRMAVGKENQTDTIVSFQIETSTSTDMALLNLLAQALSEPTFTKLRSDEQLGYFVNCHISGSKNIHFLIFLVNGPYEPAFVESRIESFVDFAVNQMIPQMNSTQFGNLKASMILNYLKKATQMEDEAHKSWYAITSGDYFFDSHAVLAAETEKLTHKQLIDFAKNHIGDEAQGRRKLSVHVKLKEDSKMKVKSSVEWFKYKNSSRSVIEDENYFKRSMKLSGIPEPRLKLKLLGKNH